jgi:hypothetical protein
MPKRVKQGDLPVVEGVVVRHRHARDPQVDERLDRHRRGAEEERLARDRTRLPALGDAALQVQHEHVGLVSGVHDTR